MLLKIDNSKHRFKELNRVLKTDPEFEEFTATLLKEIGCIDSNGQFIS